MRSDWTAWPLDGDYPDKSLCSLIGISSLTDVPPEEERMSNLASMLLLVASFQPVPLVSKRVPTAYLSAQGDVQNLTS